MNQIMKATLVAGVVTGFASQLPWLVFIAL
jgi:hypothetical protein